LVFEEELKKAKDPDSLINAMKGRFHPTDFLLALERGEKLILMFEAVVTTKPIKTGMVVSAAAKNCNKPRPPANAASSTRQEKSNATRSDEQRDREVKKSKHPSCCACLRKLSFSGQRDARLLPSLHDDLAGHFG